MPSCVGLGRTAVCVGAVAFMVCAAVGCGARADTQFPQDLQSTEWPQRPPQTIGGPADWLNTNGKALQIEPGHVYLIDFWEYTCINCLRTLSYLKAWNERYARDGLIIIGIHTPEFRFAAETANVAAAVKRLGITYPVLVDSGYANWNAYHNSTWPHHYLIDGAGWIVSDHEGEGGYEESESQIQTLLHRLHPNLRFPHPMAAVRDTDVPGAVCYPTTPELYAGLRGDEEDEHGNIEPFRVGGVATFHDAGPPHEDGKIYANGLWRTEQECLRHARKTRDMGDYIALRYHALECNAVIKPEGGAPLRVYVAQDNKPVAKADAGADIKYDEAGYSYLEVDQPRMYRVTKNARFGTHELRLASASPDFGLYSFTFSSCQVK